MLRRSSEPSHYSSFHRDGVKSSVGVDIRFQELVDRSQNPLRQFIVDVLGTVARLWSLFDVRSTSVHVFTCQYVRSKSAAACTTSSGQRVFDGFSECLVHVLLLFKNLIFSLSNSSPGPAKTIVSFTLCSTTYALCVPDKHYLCS